MAINVLDLSVIVLAILFAVVGIWRKLSGELGGLISAVLVFVITCVLSAPFAEVLVASTRLNEYPEVALALAYNILAIGLVVVAFWIRVLTDKIVKITFATPLELIGGFLAGFTKTVFVLALVFTAIGLWPRPYLKQKIDESMFGRMVFELACSKLGYENFENNNEAESEVINGDDPYRPD